MIGSYGIVQIEQMYVSDLLTVNRDLYSFTEAELQDVMSYTFTRFT